MSGCQVGRSGGPARADTNWWDELQGNGQDKESKNARGATPPNPLWRPCWRGAGGGCVCSPLLGEGGSASLWKERREEVWPAEQSWFNEKVGNSKTPNLLENLKKKSSRLATLSASHPSSSSSSSSWSGFSSQLDLVVSALDLTAVY